MRIKPITIASAVLWGAAMFLVGLINLAHPPYGADFLRIMSSVYPGYHDSRTLVDVLVGAVYGIVDGGIAGFVFGAVYNLAAGREKRPAHPTA